MEKENQLFRKKSLDRLNSPEQLQDYMRVTSPGIWMLLVSIVVLLLGLVICSSVGRLETKIPVVAKAQGGTVTVILSEADAGKVKEGMEIRISDQTGKIDSVYLKDSGEMACEADMALADGAYEGEIVTESVSPIHYLLN